MKRFYEVSFHIPDFYTFLCSPRARSFQKLSEDIFLSVQSVELFDSVLKRHAWQYGTTVMHC